MQQSKTIIGIIIAVLLIAAGGYFILAGGFKTQAPSPTQPQAPSAGETAAAKELTVIGTEFQFSPSSISLKEGEKVKIVFRNDGSAPHNLTLEGLGAKTKTISSGQQDTIEFTAPATGTYAFFCSVPGHRSNGMEGDLKVE